MIYDSGCVLSKIYSYLDSTGLTIKIKAIKLQTLITSNITKYWKLYFKARARDSDLIMAVELYSKWEREEERFCIIKSTLYVTSCHQYNKTIKNKGNRKRVAQLLFGPREAFPSVFFLLFFMWLYYELHNYIHFALTHLVHLNTLRVKVMKRKHIKSIILNAKWNNNIKNVWTKPFNDSLSCGE